MTKVKVDLEELVLSFGFDDEELATEYLNRDTGEIINIPRNVMKAAEGSKAVEELDEWERELLEEAESILEDSLDKYLMIPNIKGSYVYNNMVDFSQNVITDISTKETLNKSLRSLQPMREFKRAISKDMQIQDLWYEYEDEKAKDYVREWLRNNNIDFEEI